jgi:hypothetical protein
MATPETSTASKAASRPTPAWKIALIPILTIVLVWNLSTGDKESLDAATVVETADEADVANSLGSVPESPDVGLPRFDTKPWPVVDSESIAEFDPFALSGALEQRSTVPASAESPQPVAAIDEKQSEQRLQEALSQLQLQGVFNGGNGPAALIGKRIVRIGDEIKPGLRVVQITASGIVVEPIEAL